VSAQVSSPAAMSSRLAARADPGVRAVIGVLPDGVPFFAPIGAIVADGDRIACHLCGRLFRSVTVHLRVHGWTKEQYCLAFGLERGQPLEGTQTRKQRSASFAARLIFDAAVRDGSAAGRARARSGELTMQAAGAARGRAFPEQRRRKAQLARAAIASDALQRASRERADRHLQSVAASAAARAGYPDIGALVVARAREGASLAAISRESGLHKDWLSRHLRRIDPEAAARASGLRPGRPEAGWSVAIRGLGFDDVQAYLRDRHLTRHRSVNAIAGELGTSHHAVAAVMRMHGIEPVAHAAKRHAAGQRAVEVARQLGFPTVTAYVTQRRASGLTWRSISEESGQPQSWLRRHADLASCPSPAD
jgi:ROS/MUCR transcriptional regulator protein